MAVKGGVVRVSGRGVNVDFTIDDSAPFEQVTWGLREYLVENRELWSSGTISVNAGRWMYSKDQLERIKQLIESESGLTVGRFWCTPEDIDGATANSVSLNGGNSDSVSPSSLSPNSVSILSTPPAPPPPAQSTKGGVTSSRLPASKLQQRKAASTRKGLQSETLFIKSTFRSGESVDHPGDVVVLADVNPGGEISAEGDIVVFGSLRGLAHAGSSGDVKATIIALHLDSPRIQIGPYTGLAPTDQPRPGPMQTGPKIAYVKRRSIYVSNYSGRFARYSRGTLYDG